MADVNQTQTTTTPPTTQPGAPAPAPAPAPVPATPPAPAQPTTVPAIDYGKIQQMLDGTLAAKEDTALKAYFKQQGLSQQEVEQAIAAFKEQKAKNQPDVAAIQQQMQQALAQAQQAQIERDAYQLSGELGIDMKTMPYVLKLADMSSVVGADGNIDREKLKEALNKVLEDVPQLKPQAVQQQNGFRQIGVGSPTQNQTPPGVPAQPSNPAVPTKKWNRWG